MACCADAGRWTNKSDITTAPYGLRCRIKARYAGPRLQANAGRGGSGAANGSGPGQTRHDATPFALLHPMLHPMQCVQCASELAMHVKGAE